MLATTGRLLAAHWPALLAWYLAGVVAHYAAIQLAGFVGAWSDLGGALLLPLAPLAKLTAYVAMLLVVREGLRHLGALAPLPLDSAERRRDFGRALLGGIVPFVAFYTAYSYLENDMWEFIGRALAVRSEHAFDHIDFANPDLSGSPREWDYVPGELIVSPVSLTVVAVAFAARWMLGRARLKKIGWLTPLGVYLEALWVTVSLMLVLDLVGIVTGWVEGRMAIVWLADARVWLADMLFPIVWAWDALIWLIGEAGAVILLPVAWLAVAGSIYGHAVAAKAPELSSGFGHVRRRYERLGAPVKRVVRDTSTLATSRFAPIARAVVLMWRAGPVLIGGYVLLYAIVTALEPLLLWLQTRIIGPQDFQTFWLAVGNAVRRIPDILLQPVLIAVVAAAYDATLRRLVPGGSAGALPADAVAPAAVAVPPGAPLPPGAPRPVGADVTAR